MTPAENEIVAEVGLTVEALVGRIAREQSHLERRGDIPMPASFLAVLKSELLGIYSQLAELPMEVEIPA